MFKQVVQYFCCFEQVEVEKFRRAGYRQGQSPADALLSCWGQKNCTVIDLFKLLWKMKHHQVSYLELLQLQLAQ
jgi:hypothetical protein